MTRLRGLLLFSTYSETFWPHRVQWFEVQAANGLVGDIDYSATHPGEIVCKDGFRSGTLSVAEFKSICGHFDAEPTFVEVDESTICSEPTNRAKVAREAARAVLRQRGARRLRIVQRLPPRQRQVGPRVRASTLRADHRCHAPFASSPETRCRAAGHTPARTCM